eukprot:GSChrysophyteH1.ASY1.ANO1.2427.1 assembled CDS
MDITKLTGNSFNASGLFGRPEDGQKSSVATFLDDTNEVALTNKVSDLLSSTRMRHQRQFTERRELAKSASTSVLPQSPGAPDGTGGMKKTKKGKHPGRGSKVDDTAFNVIERPANRVDIAKLERELEVRVRAVVDIDSVSIEDPNELADPRKDGMIIIRDKLLQEFGADLDRLTREPWLDQLIKCECIKISCDDVAKKLVDMLSVSSVQLGNVLRNLRLAYMQSFDQMRVSWQCLRATFVEYEEELFMNREQLQRLSYEVENKEADLRREMDVEIREMTASFEEEKQLHLDALNESEFKMGQMAETLQSLNGIFKNMQSDGSTVRVADLDAKCDRLEKDNKELNTKVLAMDKIKSDLEVALEKIASLEKENRAKDVEIASLKQQMIRREETVVALMERESIRNAEIEKMKDITNIQGDDEDYGSSMKEPSTSVLCIKCKKGLDDLSNIRAAILNKSDKAAISCENFRVLLPNLRGRRPNRSTEWLRRCMRDIFVSKMREDMALLDIKGNISKFSAYTYAWFSRPVDFANGGSELKTLQEADEDRWGLYYGVKAMARENDPEATIFWTLLEERHGEDGMQFIFHCLSMCMSMGGPDLWKQFGASLQSNSTSIGFKSKDKPDVRGHIWLDVGTAIESVKAILVRALKPHVQEVVDAIYAFRVLPEVADPQIKAEKEKKAKKEGEEGAEGAENPEPNAAERGEPTHICIFVWLRLMLQQMQAEQIHRAAAVRLMCESASVGALTPQLQSVSDADDLGSSGMQVEYPQFSMIAKTLFPGISTLDSASLFHACYEEGRRKVTSEVLLKVADRVGLFSKAMRLTVLPLLRHDIKEGKTFEQLQKLRMRLATLIHRKFQGLMPDYELLLNRVSERWKATLENVKDNVQQALLHATDKIKRDKLSSNDLKAPSDHFVDGIQPYVAYRRFLSTMLLVKAYSDNPLLPSELFLGQDRSLQPSFDYSFKHVENLLSSLEAGVITSLRLDKVESSIYRFEATRRNLVTRKIQNFYRCYFRGTNHYGGYSTHYYKSVVPPSVRQHMRPGYLRGMRYLKQRDVPMPPWWAQLQIAEIVAYKINHDVTAARIGQKALTLGKAVMAFSLNKWSSVEVAERNVQDFMQCIKNHHGISSRLSLFAAMLGALAREAENNDDVMKVLQTDLAISLYINLLADIHREIAALNMQGTRSRSLILYLSRENPIGTATECSQWEQQPRLLSRAASRWARNMTGLSSEHLAVFPEFALQLDKNEDTGKVSVDDFLWLCMKQWATYTAYAMHRCAARAAHAIKTCATPPKYQSDASAADATEVMNAMYEEADKTDGPVPPPAPFTMTYLNSIIASVYKTNESQIDQAVDSGFIPVAYMQSLCMGTLKSQSLEAVRKLLRECSLWDAHAFKRASRNPVENDSSVDDCDSEPASVLSFGYVVCGTGDMTKIAEARIVCANYLPVLQSWIENKAGELKRRQKNFSKAVIEVDRLLWDFGACKKAIDAVKIPLRSLQHVKDNDLWEEKGAESLWEKLRTLMSAVQDLVVCTSVHKFECISTKEDDLSNPSPIGMLGQFPSELPEIAKRVQLIKPVQPSLRLYKTQMKNLA